MSLEFQLNCLFLTSALLLLEVMATPTSITLDEEGFEEGGVTKLPNKKSEYAKVLAVSLCIDLI
jgi:hypothetical protein